MATDCELDTDRFYFENEELSVVEDEDFGYDNVSIDEDLQLHISGELAENLHEAVRIIKDAAEDEKLTEAPECKSKPTVIKKPEIVDDFVRNFLVHMNMKRTLDCFQTEWYELQQKGLINAECVAIVPDLYSKHVLLEEELRSAKKELQKYKQAGVKAKELYVKLRKERDFHRMHHNRVVQEKDKLILDIQRMKDHYVSMEPAIQKLKGKYETAMKEKMLSQLERDRAIGQALGLQQTLQSFETMNPADKSMHEIASGLNRPDKIGRIPLDKDGNGPTQKALLAARSTANDTNPKVDDSNKNPCDTQFPIDRGVNPRLTSARKVVAKITKAGGFHLSTSFVAHNYPISSIALHPKKDIIATTSDDHKWKMWSIPLGDVILTGVGHTDWVANCSFHPKGKSLATCGGDGTVKIWGFNKTECLHTFTDHMGPVWDCDWHSCGDFLASCSQDTVCRIWDINSLRCRTILRGHTSCVNSVEFVPCANIVLSASADKTISLWDCRTGICAQTFYGHQHAINHATVNAKGDMVASCDAYGVFILWDIRTVAPMAKIDNGPSSSNHVNFDISSSMVAIAGNDSKIKMYQLATGNVTTMVGHEDSVQSVKIGYSGEYIVSAGNDCNVRIWC